MAEKPEVTPEMKVGAWPRKENPDSWTEVTHLIQKVLAEHEAVNLRPHERPIGRSLAFAIETRLRRAGMLVTKRAESPGSGWVSATADVRKLLAIYDDDSKAIATALTLATKSQSFKKAWYAERAKRVAELRAKYAGLEPGEIEEQLPQRS